METLSFELMVKMLSENPNVVILIIAGALVITAILVIMSKICLGIAQKIHEEDANEPMKRSKHCK